MRKEDFDLAFYDQQSLGGAWQDDRISLSIPDSAAVLRRGMQWALDGQHRQLVWLPEYDKIGEWLADTQGKGLLLMGSVGVGKSMIAAHLLPLIIKHHAKRIVHVYGAMDINDRWADVVKAPIKVIDDIGRETTYRRERYGEPLWLFSELMDAVERKGHMLIGTTNMTPQQLQDRYGERTRDRVKQYCKVISIVNKSLR